MDPNALQLQIRTLVEPTVARLGFDLVAVEWSGGRTGPLLRLSIDAPGGVSAEDCATVSEQVSPLLDASDPVPSAYTLEVSSPGIDRPVQRRADFERFVGYRVRLRLFEGPPRRRYVGVIGPIEGEELLVSVDGAEHRIPLDQIERAHLVLDLDEYQRLGAASGQGP
ncbi:MAG: ribosome maturation factor RimP [Myxococcota bacterium]